MDCVKPPVTLFAEFLPVMHFCPNCQQASFSDLQKLTLLWLRPRKCMLCHKAAYLPVRNIIVALIVWTLLSWVFIGIAIAMRNVVFMLGSIPAAVFAVDLWIRKAPLIAFES